MKKLYFFGAVLLIAHNLFAQTTFLKVFHSESEAFSGITQSNGNDYVIAGYTYTNAHTIIRKIDTLGNIIWQKEIRNVFNPGEVISTKGDGYAISARVHNNMGILKINKKGNVQWTKYYEDSSLKNNYATTITEAYDSGYLITGYINKMLSIIKTNSQGNLSWKKFITINGNTAGEIKHVVNTADSAYLIILNKQQVFHLIKINNNGKLVWIKSYGDSTAASTNYVSDFIKKTPDKGFIITGIVFSDKSAMFVIKVDSTGNKEWGISAGKGYDWTWVTCADASNDKTYIINGIIRKGSNFGKLITVKLDNNGNIIWSTFNSLQQTPVLYNSETVHTNDRGFIIGFTGFLDQYHNISILKFDKNGYGCAGVARKLAGKNLESMVSSKPVYLKNIKGLTTFSDAATSEDINTTIDVLCSNESDNNPHKIMNAVQAINTKPSAYPNPANNNCQLSFYAEKQSAYSIQCINITGKVLFQKTVKAFAGKNVLNIDVSKFSAGTYYINIKSNTDEIQRCKLVKE